MRILLIGNHTCGNRGDAAIARGLMHGIQQVLPSSEIVFTSRYPVSSAYLLERDVVPDLFHKMRLGAGRWGSFKRRLLPYLILLSNHISKSAKKVLLPKSVLEQIEYLSGFDLVIQVGGSFFVDLYGVRQFEAPLATTASGTPLLVLGHSMGPLGGVKYKWFVRELLRRAAQITIREPISLKLLADEGLPLERVRAGCDTAWLIDSADPEGQPIPKRNRIGITVRELAPFDKRLGITQEAYESAFANLADALMEEGYEVVAASTCTGIESYNRDDRMIALRIRSRVKQPHRFQVVMNELNDLELLELFSSCDLVVGTRLHSAIIALCAGTPAIALNYEHKSEGIMKQLNLPDLAQPISSLLDGELLKQAQKVLESLDEVRASVASAVSAERARTLDTIREAIKVTRGGGR